MIRQMIKIDESQCNGCGLCVSACHEGAIGLVNGKAVLLREDYCDGLGNCLPVCPTGAISFEMREAPEFNHEAVQQSSTCPGTMAKVLRTDDRPGEAPASAATPQASQLRQWPVQIKLVAPNAGFLNNCDLLVAADCTAYAFGDFHNTFLKNRVALIGCPKLDETDYAQKLAQILAHNTIKSVTVVKMEVPCCFGIESAVKRAIAASGKIIPLASVTISTDGEILR